MNYNLKNPIINLFHFVNEVQNLKFLEATLYIDHENGDPKNPGPMIEWTENSTEQKTS